MSGKSSIKRSRGQLSPFYIGVTVFEREAHLFGTRPRTQREYSDHSRVRNYLH